MKIAILHEMLIKLGGAEKVVEKISSIFPDAPIYTLIYDEEKVGKVFEESKVITEKSTQRIYNITKNQRFCLPFMPKAVESLDLSDFDVVICSSSGFAHGAITKSETKFIVYYHSPARYLWDWTNEYKNDIGGNKGLKGFILNYMFLKLRQWDFIASHRVDINLANSKNSALRVKKYYKKECEILYPPIETSRFNKEIKPSGILNSILSSGTGFRINENEKNSLLNNDTNVNNYINDSEINSEGQKNYYIIISALTEFKKLDVAIEGFNKMSDKNLVIIGAGNYRETLENKVSGKNIIFTGARYGDELVELVQGSLGLVFPGEEDFGIVPIEAMANGKPIFAYRAGGLLETVIDNKTGNFFDDKNGYDFVPKFLEFDEKVKSGFFDKDLIKKHALQFDESLFEKRLKEIVGV